MAFNIDIHHDNALAEIGAILADRFSKSRTAPPPTSEC